MGSVFDWLVKTFQDSFNLESLEDHITPSNTPSPPDTQQHGPSISEPLASEQHSKDYGPQDSHKSNCTAMDPSVLAVAQQTCLK